MQRKETSITNSECVFVALGVQHTKRMRCMFICGVLGSTFLIKVTILLKTIIGLAVVNLFCLQLTTEKISPAQK